MSKGDLKRNLLIILGAVGIGGTFLGLGILTMSNNAPGNMLNGKITAKHFQPQPEEQLTVGSDGLSSRKLDGSYTLEVYADSEKKSYTVWVDKTLYDEKKVGEEFSFLRPPSEQR